MQHRDFNIFLLSHGLNRTHKLGCGVYLQVGFLRTMENSTRSTGNQLN